MASNIIPALTKEYKVCKARCMAAEGVNSKDYCRQKCRNEYYAKIERAKLQRKNLKNK